MKNIQRVIIPIIFLWATLLATTQTSLIQAADEEGFVSQDTRITNITPVTLNYQLVSPTPPGGTLLPPAPALPQDATIKLEPWAPPNIGILPQIIDIHQIYEFITPFDLLIIADEQFVDALKPLKAHKDATDIPTRIYSWQELVQRFHSQGRDDPERIKKAIAAFRKGCNIKYVMLVGDVDRFPVRYCKGYDSQDWGDGYAPSDLYYADLFKANGTEFDDWDGNHNNIFCEIQGANGTLNDESLSSINLDGIDLYPDVAVGRVPASTTAEVTIYVNKVIQYEFAAYKTEWSQKALLIVPGYLDDNDGKYYDYPGSWQAKEVVSTTLAAAGLTPTKLYDSRIVGLTAGLSNGEPTALNIKNFINGGLGFVNFLGHGGPDTWGPYNISDLAALTNSDKLPIVFAGACSTAQFHFGTTFMDVNGHVFNQLTQCPVYNGAHRCWPANPNAAHMPEPANVQPAVYDSDSMAEEFLVKRNTGAVAYIGAYTGTQGGSQMLDKYFFEGYRYMMHPAKLGYMWNYAVRRYIANNFHIDFGAGCDWCPAAMWHHIHKYMLFGDPSLRVGGISTIQRADFVGTFQSDHDGWRGHLTLQKADGNFIEGTPNMSGTYTDGSGKKHGVRGYVRTADYPLTPASDPDHKITFYIDFNDTATQNDDQKFEGYLFTRTKNAVAGITYWNNIPFGFFINQKGNLQGGPQLISGPVTTNSFIGTYSMNHDGWEGVLKLWRNLSTIHVIGSDFWALLGQYTDQNNKTHAVRGKVKESVANPAGWVDHKIEFYIDFNDTITNQNDDQKFEGYLFTQTKDGMAGITWWNNTPFGFYAEKERPPAPHIYANGATKTLHISHTEQVSVTVQLDPGVLKNSQYDWWAVAATPFGFFSFVPPGIWQAGIHNVFQYMPVALPPYEILNIALPPGTYTFYFGLDDQPDNQLNGNIYYDGVEVTVD
ncbi:MAG: C25 family cysteine peptidase [Deltaproteobacteria bacterium]|nr:C25 family cysteine peptidase [Deltaproteobacteria bacterium]